MKNYLLGVLIIAFCYFFLAYSVFSGYEDGVKLVYGTLLVIIALNSNSKD